MLRHFSSLLIACCHRKQQHVAAASCVKATSTKLTRATIPSSSVVVFCYTNQMCAAQQHACSSRWENCKPIVVAVLDTHPGASVLANCGTANPSRPARLRIPQNLLIRRADCTQAKVAAALACSVSAAHGVALDGSLDRSEGPLRHFQPRMLFMRIDDASY